MNDLAGDSLFGPAVVAFCLTLTRVSSFVVASPIFGRGTVPNSIKVGFCVTLALFWAPGYASHLTVAANPSNGLVAFLLLSEFIIGITLGFLIRLVMLPTRIAGSYVGQELGFNLGQITAASSDGPTNETGLLFDALALAVFWVSDVHHIALRMLGLSFLTIDDGIELAINFAPTAGELFSDAHEFGILLIMPLAAILFFALVYLMVVMRSWPQMTLFSFGMAARLMIGLAAFFFLAPFIVSQIEILFDTLGHTVWQLVRRGT